MQVAYRAVKLVGEFYAESWLLKQIIVCKLLVLGGSFIGNNQEQGFQNISGKSCDINTRIAQLIVNSGGCDSQRRHQFCRRWCLESHLKSEDRSLKDDSQVILKECILMMSYACLVHLCLERLKKWEACLENAHFCIDVHISGYSLDSRSTKTILFSFKSQIVFFTVGFYFRSVF